MTKIYAKLSMLTQHLLIKLLTGVLTELLTIYIYLNNYSLELKISQYCANFDSYS